MILTINNLKDKVSDDMGLTFHSRVEISLKLSFDRMLSFFAEHDEKCNELTDYIKVKHSQLWVAHQHYHYIL